MLGLVPRGQPGSEAELGLGPRGQPGSEAESGLVPRGQHGSEVLANQSERRIFKCRPIREPYVAHVTRVSWGRVCVVGMRARVGSWNRAWPTWERGFGGQHGSESSLLVYYIE